MFWQGHDGERLCQLTKMLVRKEKPHGLYGIFMKIVTNHLISTFLTGKKRSIHLKFWNAYMQTHVEVCRLFFFFFYGFIFQRLFVSCVVMNSSLLFSFSFLFYSRFETGGHGTCLKKYSDPTFFQFAWAASQSEKAEQMLRDWEAQEAKVCPQHPHFIPSYYTTNFQSMLY